MYALCVSGAVNTQGFVWKLFYALYINFHSFIHPAHCLTVSLCYTPSRQLRSSADTRMLRVSHVRTKRPLANAVFPAVLYSNEIRP